MGFITKKINGKIMMMEVNMETSLKDTLKYYCEKEIEKFVSSSIYSKLNELVEFHKFNLKLEFGKGKEEKDKNIYLSLSILDINGKLVEFFDDGFLTTATMLIMNDKKNRLRFFSWQDEEFIEDLNWIINKLKEIKNK